MSMIGPLRGPRVAPALASPGAHAPARPEPRPVAPAGARRTLLAWIRAPAVWITAAVVLLSWHALPLKPKTGIGPSWEAAMHMAHHFGITFGNHLIFTYGPLGFLSAPTLWYAGTGTLAVLYTLLARAALAAAVFLAARRSFGTRAAAIGALLVLDASGKTAEVVPVTVPFLILAVWVVDREWSRRQLLTLLGIAGAVAGFELLNKASVGLEMGALAIVMALAARGRRVEQLLVTVLALLVTLLVAWIAAGQDLGALGAFVRNSEQIVTGYAPAQGFESGGLKPEFLAAPVAFAIGLAVALDMTAGERVRSRRWGIIALWLLFCFFQFKEAFVRHDATHGAVYFVALLGAFFAFVPRPANRLAAALGASLLLVFAVAAQKSNPISAFNPVGNAKSAITQLADVAVASKRNAIAAEGRRSIQSAYPLDPATLAQLRGKTVHVLPVQVSVAWAYRLAWRPLPVFQSYSAYTTSLDELDAKALVSPQAPQRILRNHDAEIDERLEAFDQGATTREILCRYQELRTTSEWQVLGVAQDRCLAPVALGTVHAGWSQRVAVPAPPNANSFVFVRIGGVGLGSGERLLSLLYKPPTHTVTLDSGRYRLVEGTAADGLILRAPAGVDFSAPFHVAPDSSTIAVGKTGQGAGGGQPITYSFYAQAVRSGPRAPGTGAAR